MIKKLEKLFCCYNILSIETSQNRQAILLLTLSYW